MSNISSTGTLHGVIYRGVGGATSYGELTGKPKINNVTIDGDKTGHDYNLANLSDIPDVPTPPPSYAMNVHHDDYYTEELNWIMSNDIQKQWKVYSSIFTYPTASSDGEKGLVPKAFAGDEDKILSASGWTANKMNVDFYSSEVDTGINWIDGKRIYQKVVQIPAFSANGWSYAILNIQPDTIIKYDGLLTDGTSYFPFNYPRSTSIYFATILAIDNNNWTIQIYKNMAGTFTGHVIVYYTK